MTKFDYTNISLITVSLTVQTYLYFTLGNTTVLGTLNRSDHARAYARDPLPVSPATVPGAQSIVIDRESYPNLMELSKYVSYQTRSTICMLYISVLITISPPHKPNNLTQSRAMN